jgi:signal peptide peptidase SppA
MNLGDLGRIITLQRFRDPPPVVAVIPLAGIIGRPGPIRRGLTLAGLAEVIERAFKLRHLKAVALAVNSPGGSAVQSALIAKRIRDLASEKNVPVYAFAEDVAASGGYWLALAADEIYADASSIVGSIGVVYGGFGFAQAIRRLGIERRLHTAGDKKAMLDPFRPEKAAEVRHLKDLQRDIHESFKAQVLERRGARLKATQKELFSGAFWTGRRALEMGLVDGLGDMRGVMRDKFGERVKLKRIAAGAPPWRRLGLVRDVGRRPSPADWAEAAVAAIEERLMWNRFGL